MKPGTSYEKLVRDIVQLMLLKEGLDVIAEHDKKITGISGQTHQIDVYWEFKIGGILHRVAIECKEWGKTVSIGTVRSVHSILQDVPGLRGIIVTKNGYQEGAIGLAETYGISLKLIREPMDSDYEGRIKTIKISMTCLTIDVCLPEIKFGIDSDWYKNNSRNPPTEIALNALTNEIHLMDLSDNSKKYLSEIFDHVPRDPKMVGIVQKYQIDLTDGYLIIPGQDQIKLKSFGFEYKILSSTEDFEISSDAQYIVKDILLDTSTFINKDGSISGDL